MRISFLLFALLCICTHIQAQKENSKPDQSKKHSNRKQWKNGFIVKITGDTIYGLMRISNYTNDFNNSSFYDYQNKLSFEDKIGADHEYTPDSLRSFTYYTDGAIGIDTITLMSIINPLGFEGKVFCRLYQDGLCKDYGYYTTTSTGGRFEVEFIQMNGADFIRIKLVGFKEKMKQVFSMCPLIVSKLDTKKYTYDNWEDMVRDYNKGLCK